MHKKTNVLFFANVPVLGIERSIGGATVLAKKILTFLENENDIAVDHIQIRSFWRKKLQIVDYFLWIFKFPFYIKKYDVISFHGTKDFHFTIAPILYLWCRLLRKGVVYHFFGGNFHDQYKRLPGLFKYIVRKTLLRSDTVFFETKQMINYFKGKIDSNTVWLPNSRKPIQQKKNNAYSKKFVFISRVIPEKGIEQIIEAAEKTPEDYTIDIYGPIDERRYKKDIFTHTKVHYKGILKPTEVLDTLQDYDVLLLPSFFKGEGYPGIIIEALALGKPAIATHWKALPEIITDGYNGFLIDPKNTAQLVTAMTNLNTRNYTTFSKNALKSFENFNSELVFKKIVDSYLC